MEVIRLETEIEVYGNDNELPVEDRELIAAARTALKGAHAPYSEFSVGAAVLLQSGEIVLGSNQENASYPHGMCAERVALFAAGAQYPGVAVKAVAIVASSKNKDNFDPATPCGGCRQTIAEYEQKHRQPMRLILGGDGEKYYVLKEAGTLLPMSFKFQKNRENH